MLSYLPLSEAIGNYYAKYILYILTVTYMAVRTVRTRARTSFSKLPLASVTAN